MKYKSFIDDRENDINNSKISKILVIFLIIIYNFFFIILIYNMKISIEKENENNYYNINQISYNYLKYLNKISITEKRISHLFNVKNNIKDYFDSLIILEKTIIKISWKILLKYKNEIIKDLNKKICSFLYLPNANESENISNILFKIMVEDESINNFKDNINIQNIIKKLENKEEKEIIKNKINIILLYTFLNLPLQYCYFSKDSIKINFKNEVNNQMKLFPNNQILANINPEMGIYSNNSIYMVLGSTQDNVLGRITAKNPEIPYINICNIGLRTQILRNEIDSLVDNIKNYYINPKYKNIIKQCTGHKIMNYEIYNNFINDCSNLLNNPTIENESTLFGKYSFSIETANTVINYLKLNVSLDDIIIIRLGEKNTNNKKLKYNKNKVYILFNVIDVSETFNLNYKIIRATTEANAKVLYYLKNECPNFFNEEDYNNIVLVSNKLFAERQLEAFNIISNIFGYGFEFNSIIWNKKDEINLTDKHFSDYLVDIVVKSFHLISISKNKINIDDYNKNKNENLLDIIKFIEDMFEMSEKINIT